MRNQEDLEKKAFWRVVIWTFTVLGFVTSINVFFILNAVGTDLFKPLQRNIAAVPKPEALIKEKIISPVIEFNCLKKQKQIKITTKAPTARILFKNCQKISGLHNEANKNQGSLFSTSKNGWTSDYLSLNHGQNPIKVQLRNDIQVIEITRENVKKPKAAKAL